MDRLGGRAIVYEQGKGCQVLDHGLLQVASTMAQQATRVTSLGTGRRPVATRLPRMASTKRRPWRHKLTGTKQTVSSLREQGDLHRHTTLQRHSLHRTRRPEAVAQRSSLGPGGLPLALRLSAGQGVAISFAGCTHRAGFSRDPILLHGNECRAFVRCEVEHVPTIALDTPATDRRRALECTGVLATAVWEYEREVT